MNSAEGASLNRVNLSGKSTSIGRSSGERQCVLATQGDNLSGTEDRVVGIEYSLRLSFFAF